MNAKFRWHYISVCFLRMNFAYPRILIVSYLSYQFRGLMENSAGQVNRLGIFRHFTMSLASQYFLFVTKQTIFS